MPNIVCELPDCNNKLPKGQIKYCSKQCKFNRDKRVQRAKEEGKEYIIETKNWKYHDCAVAYCCLLNKAFPNVFFGVRPVTDKYLSTAKEV